MWADCQFGQICCTEATFAPSVSIRWRDGAVRPPPRSVLLDPLSGVPSLSGGGECSHTPRNQLCPCLGADIRCCYDDSVRYVLCSHIIRVYITHTPHRVIIHSSQPMSSVPTNSASTHPPPTLCGPPRCRPLWRGGPHVPQTAAPLHRMLSNLIFICDCQRFQVRSTALPTRSKARTVWRRSTVPRREVCCHRIPNTFS